MDRDPLRSGAIFRVQSPQHYRIVRSPLPRSASVADHIHRPIPQFPNVADVKSPSPAFSVRPSPDDERGCTPEHGLRQLLSPPRDDTRRRFQRLCDASPLPRVFCAASPNNEARAELHNTEKDTMKGSAVESPAVDNASSSCNQIRYKGTFKQKEDEIRTPARIARKNVKAKGGNLPRTRREVSRRQKITSQDVSSQATPKRPKPSAPARQTPKASSVVVTTRSGRRSLPVLDWWRSQRLSSHPDGTIQVQTGSSHDQLFGSDALLSSHDPGRSRGEKRPRKNVALKARGDESSSSTEKSANSGSWTKIQLDSLNAAQMAISPSRKRFWHHVAHRVDGKTDEECQIKWFEHFGSPDVKRAAGRRKLIPSTTSARLKGERSRSGTIVNEKPADGASQDDPAYVLDNKDDLFKATPIRCGKRARQLLASNPRTHRRKSGKILSANEAAQKTLRSGAKVEPGPRESCSRMEERYKMSCSSRRRRVESSRIRGRCDASVSTTPQEQMKKRVGKKTRVSVMYAGRTMRASLSNGGSVAVNVGERDDSEGDATSSYESGSSSS